MVRYGEKRPMPGDPVWVWDLGAWRVATLDVPMYPLHLHPDEKVSWEFLEGEHRRAKPEDVWVPIEAPPLPPSL